MISSNFESVQKFSEASTKNSVSFGADGRIAFSAACIDAVGLGEDNILVEPRLWLEQELVERKGKSVNKTTIKKIAFVFGSENGGATLRSPKMGNQKYISGKGYLQKNDFLRHLMNSPVRFQYDAISFDSTKGMKNNVIIVDLLKKGRNKVSK